MARARSCIHSLTGTTAMSGAISASMPCPITHYGSRAMSRLAMCTPRARCLRKWVPKKRASSAWSASVDCTRRS